MGRAVLAAKPRPLATCRADALSHARPTASSNRLLNGALLGSNGTFSTLTPQSGHFTRYTSMCTAVLNSLQGRSRPLAPGSHSVVELASAAGTLQFAVPPLTPHHSSRTLLFSSISCRYTR